VGGIFTKSIAGFRKSGLSGFADGAARGVVGLGTSTAAGAVGFAARVVEGVEATVGGVQDGVGGVLSLSDAAAFAAATPRRAPLAVRVRIALAFPKSQNCLPVHKTDKFFYLS
jgi:hypothetical protein|tara:strand:+ start:52 stop:390 length:339 start_codon:yes stop_codon:yes gene_type:complete